MHVLQSHPTTSEPGACGASEPSMKRRRLENGASLPPGGGSPLDHQTKVIFEARDLSFSIPIRKKLHLEIAQCISSTSGTLEPVYQARARHPASGELEYKLGMESFSTKISTANSLQRDMLIPNSRIRFATTSPRENSKAA